MIIFQFPWNWRKIRYLILVMDENNCDSLDIIPVLSARGGGRWRREKCENSDTSQVPRRKSQKYDL